MEKTLGRWSCEMLPGRDLFVPLQKLLYKAIARIIKRSPFPALTLLDLSLRGETSPLAELKNDEKPPDIFK